MSNLPNQITSKEEARRQLWSKGNLSWKMDDNQLTMRQFIFNTEFQLIVIAASRRIGKSYALSAMAIETCLKTPNVVVKYIAPKLNMARRIIAPLIKELSKDAPKSCMPKYHTQEMLFKFPNGSEIQLAGTDNGNADNIRGGSAHLCIVDEAGFCDELDYVVKAVLMPTVLTTGGKIVLSSTPSSSPDHDFMKFKREAELEGRFIKRTIYDNPRLSLSQIESMAKSQGGVTSVSFRREYLCEDIISEDDAVIPEFTRELEERIVKDWVRPPFADHYVSMDIGSKDLTFVLFAYYDFQNAKIIIEDEIVMSGKGMLTDSLAIDIKRKEQMLWKSPVTLEPIPPYMRIADNNNPILLNDLSYKHQLHFIPTLKDNAEAALNNMRMLLRNEQIIINPRCKNLIMHLKSAIWNKQRTSYARTKELGHADGIDTLKYLCRNVNLMKNPYPADYRFMGNTQNVFNPNPPKSNENLEKGLANIFMPKLRRRFRR